MLEFFKTTLTREKLHGLFINTAMGNFAAYSAGSLVTLMTTYRVVERRAVRNLFGILPRKAVVVHVLPEWLEWTLGLLVGFLVMEFVRYSFKKYAQMLAGQPPSEKRETISSAASSASAKLPVQAISCASSRPDNGNRV
jgi:hypothetical protein